MRLVTAILLLVSAAAGCASQVERQGVLSDSTLVTVLAELYLADARARLPGFEAGVRDSVLTHYGVDSLDFQTTMDSFLDRPDDLVALYSRVMDKLNAARSP